MYAPGHNSFFKSPDGKPDWVSYHAKSKPIQGCGDFRSPRAQSFTWNKDGTPNFGGPGAEDFLISVLPAVAFHSSSLASSCTVGSCHEQNEQQTAFVPVNQQRNVVLLNPGLLQLKSSNIMDGFATTNTNKSKILVFSGMDTKFYYF